MTEREIADWEREITHAEMMSNARPLTILELIELKRNEIKDDNNEK